MNTKKWDEKTLERFGSEVSPCERTDTTHDLSQNGKEELRRQERADAWSFIQSVSKV